VARISATDFYGLLGPFAGLDAHHALALDEAHRAASAVGDVARPRPMKRLTEAMVLTLDLRLRGQGGTRIKTDLATLPRGSARPKAGSPGPRQIGQAFGHAAAHRGHQRVGGAQVNADRDAALVRIGRLAGFGDLQNAMVYCPRASRRRSSLASLLGEALNEHERPHLCCSLRRGLAVATSSKSVSVWAARGAARAATSSASFSSRLDRLRLVQGLAPFHLLHQEGGGHRGVVFGIDGARLCSSHK
jgi:hypothetical protein